MRNVLVIGGAGFIGSHLCDALLANGDTVVCLDNFLRGTEDNIREALRHPRFQLIRGDASDARVVSETLKSCDTSYVFHLAANSDIQASADDPGIEFNSTLSTTWAILSAMRENGVKKMFFASTSAVYGEQCDQALKETDSLAPVSYYGAAKMGSEALIRAFSHMNDMDICVFRFANVIGPRLTHGVIYDFINKLRADPTVLRVLGNGTQTKPYIHVDDLIRAVMLLHDTVTGTEIYNVGVEGGTAVSRIAETVKTQMGLPDARIEYGEESIGWKGDVPRFRFDLNKIHGAGWRAMLTSDEAVQMTVEEVLRCKP